MEAIAVIGGLAAVLQLADASSRCASTLIRFSKNAGSASEEIAHFATQNKTFSSSVRLAYVTLSYHCSRHRVSPVINYIRSKAILEGLDDESRYVRTRVKEADKRIRSLETTFKLWGMLRWTICRDSVLGLSPQMDSIKHSLLLVMQTVQLEVMMKDKEQPTLNAAGETSRLDDEM